MSVHVGVTGMEAVVLDTWPVRVHGKPHWRKNWFHFLGKPEASPFPNMG